MPPGASELVALAEQVKAYLGLRTYITGVKLLGPDEEIPRGFRRPLRDFGAKLPACRALNVARTYGWPVAQTVEDMLCVIGAAAFGMVEEPGYIYDSGLVGQHARNEEVARELHKALLDRFLEPGSCSAILFAPMRKPTVEPDILVAYGTPTQVALMLKALAWSGVLAKMEFVGIASCSAITYVVKKEEATASLPCAGERLLGLTEEGEAWLAMRAELLPQLAEGLKAVRRIFPYPPIKPLEEPRTPSWYPMRLEDYEEWLRKRRSSR